jgi:hypothetical protein
MIENLKINIKPNINKNLIQRHIFGCKTNLTIYLVGINLIIIKLLIQLIFVRKLIGIFNETITLP